MTTRRGVGAVLASDHKGEERGGGTGRGVGAMALGDYKDWS